METLFVVGVIAVIWYLVSGNLSGRSSPRIDTTSHRHGSRTPGSSPGTPATARSPAQTLRAAIEAGRDVRFRYTDAKGNITHRTVHPRRFVEFELTHGEGRSLCVEGHCRLRNDTRHFALRRMSELEIL